MGQPCFTLCVFEFSSDYKSYMADCAASFPSAEMCEESYITLIDPYFRYLSEGTKGYDLSWWKAPCCRRHSRLNKRRALFNLQLKESPKSKNPSDLSISCHLHVTGLQWQEAQCYIIGNYWHLLLESTDAIMNNLSPLIPTVFSFWQGITLYFMWH